MARQLHFGREVSALDSLPGGFGGCSEVGKYTAHKLSFIGQSHDLHMTCVR